MGPDVDASLAQLSALTRRGAAIRARLAADPSAAASLADARIWQADCAAAVHQLAGGSKAHWLSRSYSDALLVRASDGSALAQASVADIVGRVLEVLDRAARALAQPDATAAAPPSDAGPTRRFDFVRHAPLRPILEQAYIESGRALDEEDYTRALKTSCSILEAVVTDALEDHARLHGFGNGDPAIAQMSFDERIAAAEKMRLIRGGCARLPPAARAYRIAAESNDDVVTRRDAMIARQVLHVVLRDLDPSR
jgi:hypothetical protein